MMDDVVFISMEGKKDFKIGDFLVREDVSLPVHIHDRSNVSLEEITPENITAMIALYSHTMEIFTLI